MRRTQAISIIGVTLVMGALAARAVEQRGGVVTDELVPGRAIDHGGWPASARVVRRVIELLCVESTLCASTLAAMRRALRSRVPGGARKWRLIEAAGPMEALRGIQGQRVGRSRPAAEALLRATTLHGKLPEAVRLAHLIASGMTEGRSRGRA